MSNPPPLDVPANSPGVAFSVTVLVNGPNGDAIPDTTTPLTFEDVQNNGAVTHIVDPNNNRRVIVKSIVPFAANGDQPFSFRVRCASVISFVTASGTARKSADLSALSWDGVAPGPA